MTSSTVLAGRAAPPLTPDGATKGSRALALGSTLALVALGLAWELWLAPTGQGWLALKIVPLLPALPGLWRYRMFTYRWLSLLVWMYFTEGVVRATSESGPSQLLALAETGLSLLIFVACVLQVRWRLKRSRDRAADHP